MRHLTERFVLALPVRISAIAQSLNRVHADPTSCDELRRHLHSMSGTAATYGFPEIARCAFAAEELCGQTLDAQSLEKLDALVRALANAVEAAR